MGGFSIFILNLEEPPRNTIRLIYLKSWVYGFVYTIIVHLADIHQALFTFMRRIEFSYFIGFLFYIWAPTLAAQCLLSEIPLKDKINRATVIVEGKVVKQQSFFNTTRTFIYTAHYVEVYKRFKGTLGSDTITLLTEGGIVDDLMISTSPQTDIQLNTFGIFMLHPTNYGFLPEEYPYPFGLYGGVQGVFRYDNEQQTASTPFRSYTTKAELYNAILEELTHPFTELKILYADSSKLISPMERAAHPQISDFSPDTTSAGTYAVLTITGSGFGSSKGMGYVEFKNADDGGNTYIQPLKSQYVNWSDTQIKVRVPKAAGTGNIRVANNLMLSDTSNDTLQIMYAELNVEKDGIAGITFLSGSNSRRTGITWRLNNNFNSNQAARDAFLRALETWNCNTFINWKVGPSTNINEAKNDFANVVTYDATNALPAGTLAVLYNYWSLCQSPSPFWISVEMDMLINKNINWEYGPELPTFTEFDFESVILHELGHGHQLAHVINHNDLMNYSIGNNETKRTLGNNNILAGNDVMQRSSTTTYCGNRPILALSANNCNNLIDIGTAESFTAFPNPSTGFITISIPEHKQDMVLDCFDIRGEHLRTWIINEVSNYISVNLMGLQPGLYLLRLNNGEKTRTIKVVLHPH